MVLFSFGPTAKLLWSVLLLSWTAPKQVNANLAFTITETATDVVVSYSGSLNTASGSLLLDNANCASTHGDFFDNTFLCVGPLGTIDGYAISLGGDGTGLRLAPAPVDISADASTGVASSIFATTIPAPSVFVPDGYTSLDQITGTSTYTGQTLATLGMDGNLGLVNTWTLLDGSGVPISGLGSSITLTVIAFSGAFGDPHFKTWVGQHYEYHGECDLVLASSKNFGSGLGLDIHIRTKTKDTWSYITSAALRIGKNIVEVQSFGKYYLNGEEGAATTNDFSGFPITHKKTKVRNSIDRRHSFEIDTGHGVVMLQVYKHFVSIHIENPTVEGFGDAVGLMGSFQNGAWLLRDGETTVSDPNEFGGEWQVQDHEHDLFVQDGSVKLPETCRLPSGPTEEARHRRLEESSVTMEMAEEACKHWIHDVELCIEDVLLTGDMEVAMAGAY